MKGMNLMINEKMYELGTKKSTIRTIFEFGRKRAAEVGEENIFDFSLGNPNVPTPKFIKDAIIEILENPNTSEIHGYTVAPGNPKVREILAKSINERFNTKFSGKNLFITSGAAAAITISFKALSEPDDEFITFAPYFPEYKCFVESVGAKLIVVPAQVEDFQINFDEFIKRINSHTKAVIINSPNNPSGAVYSEETIKKLAEILNQKSEEFSKPIFLISDEMLKFHMSRTIIIIRSFVILTVNHFHCPVKELDISSCLMKLLTSEKFMDQSPELQEF